MAFFKNNIGKRYYFYLILRKNTLTVLRKDIILFRNEISQIISVEKKIGLKKNPE
jgi:hypothetical protein